MHEITAETIKEYVDYGRDIRWKNDNYRVIGDELGQYFIRCESNGHCIGLTHTDGVTLNGDISDFYFADE